MFRKRGKWLLSLLLSTELALGTAITPALAVTRVEVADKAAASQSVRDYISAASKADAEAGYGTTTGTGISTFSLKTDDLDISTGTVATSLAEESGVEPDLSDPTISAVSDELDSMEVLADDGSDQKVGLTEDEKTAVLAMYDQYQTYWTEHADVLGVQVPFYLQYNDDKDNLGVLGEMLVLAGVSVQDVRDGNYSYDDLTGMILNFQYGDQLGVDIYGEQIRSQRDAALQAVKDSGAQTEYQKLLVLNDWLATQDTFDMSYIMNSMDKDNPAMVAPSPVKAKDHDKIYDTMYGVYEKQLPAQLKAQIKAGAQLEVWKSAIKQTVYNNALKDAGVTDESATDEQKAAAEKAAKDYLDANADAISADPKGFVTKNQSLGGEAAAEAIEQQVTAAITDDVVNKSYTEDKILDLDGDGTNETTAEGAVPFYAKQAAEGMTTGILGYWEGNHIGALCLGTSVCKGYASAYQYLVQCMHPEVYLEDKATDIDTAANWKAAADLYYKDGKLSPDANYLVDSVRITFHADVKMYGESQDEFNSDHFWNAVKVGGKWYYVDPCYTDVYSEVMMRDRVETDGYMNHLYFMFSDTSARNLYEGNFTEIKGLYEGVATDTSYEDAWFSRAKSNVYYGNGNAYYVYDSTDLISMLDEYNNGNQSDWSNLQKPARYKLVAHALDGDDTGDGDSDYTTLIAFNQSDDDDDALGKAYVYNPSTKAMEESDWLTKLYAEHAQMADTYPSIAITTALYEGKLYFNLSKYLLSYDLSTGEVKVVKSYDTVSMKRDPSKAFGGMAFTLTDDANNADFTFKNHPIAGICLKGESLTVSIATNLAYISGKDDVTNRNNPQPDANGKKGPSYTADSKDNGYGYELEETNYNPNYNSYSQDKGSQYGYKSEINDNDEFMFVANGVTTTAMSDIAASTAEYVEDTHEHHYVESDETFFTKDDNSKWNTGVSYVCTECGKGVTEPIDNSSMGGSSSDDDYEERKAEYDAAAENAKQGHKYTPSDENAWTKAEDGTYTLNFQNLACSVCEDVKDQLDCLIGDETIDVALKDKVTATAERTKVEGSCTDTENGVTETYTASGEAEGKAWTAEKDVNSKPGKHDYKWTFDWVEDGSSATASYTCARGDVEEASPSVATITEKTDARVEPTCSKEGSKTLVATVTLSDGTTTTEEKVFSIPATGEHSYADPAEGDWKWTEDGTGATLTLKCTNGGETKDFEAVVKKDDDKSVDPTYEKEGTYVYNATVTAGDKTYTATKSVTTPKLTVENETVYRLYNKYSSEHLFTKDKEERDGLIEAGWNDEGTAWVGLTYSKTPVYRLFNEYNREHLYTTDEDEKNDLVSIGWKYEKIAFYASDTKTDFPVYREFNPYETNFTHHYTANLDEHKTNIKAGWVDEGIKWYAVALDENK